MEMERFVWLKLVFIGLFRDWVGEGLAPPATQKKLLLSYVFADFGRSKPLPYREI